MGGAAPCKRRSGGLMAMLHYTLDAKKRGVEVSRELYGLFFEDINQAADGGLNAEMVINNSFEFS